MPIRLNLKGREPKGVVESRDYEATCRMLAEELLQLVDPATGRRVVSDVIRVRDTFAGPRSDLFADLLVVWDQRAPITAVSSPAIGTVRSPRPPFRPGNHRPGGWFVTSRADLFADAKDPIEITSFAPAIRRILEREPARSLT